MNTSKKNTWFRSLSGLINIAAIVSLAAGLLYLYGDTYEKAYLREFALSPDLFTRSAEQTLTTGFRVTFLGIKKNVKPILILYATFLGIIGIMWATLWVIRKKRAFFMRFRGYTRILLGSLLIVCISIGTLGPFFIFLYSAFEQGKRFARETKHEIDSGSDQVTKDMILYEDGKSKIPKQLKGCVVAASSSGFAVYAEGKIYFIPASRVIEISCPIKEKPGGSGP